MSNGMGLALSVFKTTPAEVITGQQFSQDPVARKKMNGRHLGPTSGESAACVAAELNHQIHLPTIVDIGLP